TPPSPPPPSDASAQPAPVQTPSLTPNLRSESAASSTSTSRWATDDSPSSPVPAHNAAASSVRGTTGTRGRGRGAGPRRSTGRDQAPHQVAGEAIASSPQAGIASPEAGGRVTAKGGWVNTSSLASESGAAKPSREKKVETSEASKVADSKEATTVPDPDTTDASTSSTTTPTPPVPPPAELSAPKVALPLRNRAFTGGKATTKLTPEELTEKMNRMKLQNEKLREKRAAAVADESHFAQIAAKDKEEADRLRAEEKRAEEQVRRELIEKKQRNLDLQAQINAERSATAARKLAKVQGRDWDREKLEEGKEGAERQYPSQNWKPRED
ncbi:hypothetical protein P7C70_g9334, partial [Phenoliferia sp. Uapishka_3]